MKKRVLILTILLLVLASSVLGAHTTTITTIKNDDTYETNTNNFQFLLRFNPSQKYNITLTHPSFSLISSETTPCETNSNFVKWCNIESNSFIIDINAKASLVDSNTPVTWPIEVKDAAGDITINNINVNILNDPNPPILSNLIPQNNSFIKGLSNELISVDASDIETEIKEGAMQYCVHTPPGSCETPWSAGLNCNAGTCSKVLDLSGFTEGFYAEFNLNISDNALNSKSTGWYHAQIDRTSPVITLVSPADATVTNVIPTTFTFTATDNLSPTMSCKLKINGVVVGTQTIDNDGSQKSFNIANTYYDISNINYPWNVECTDLAGNSNDADADFALIIDQVLPTITISLSASWYTGAITILHTETDNYQLNSASCEYNYNGNPWVSVPCNSNFDFDTTSCSDGPDTCTITIRASDTATNQNLASITFSVDNSPPTISTIGLSQNPTKSGNTITITSDATDPEGLSDCILKLYTGATTIDQISLPTCNGDYLVPQTATGDYSLSLKPINNVGASTELETSLTIDNDAPTIILDTPNNNTNNIGLIDFNYTAIDLVAGVNTCSLYINNSLVDQNSGLNFTQRTLTPSNEYNEWYITCSDNLGNSASSVRRIVYHDDIAPIISNIINSSDSSTATITWDTLNEFSNSTVNYSINILNLDSKVQESTSVKQHTLSLTSLSASTIYYYQIFSTDQRGNVGSSAIYNFTTAANPPSGGGGGSSGGGGGETTIICKLEDYVCGEWGECQGTGAIGSQSRTCELKEGISCIDGEQPISLRECALPPLVKEEEQQNKPGKGLASITGFSILDNLRSTPALAVMISALVILIITTFYRWIKGKGNTIHY